jgi:hypothetical protein
VNKKTRNTWIVALVLFLAAFELIVNEPYQQVTSAQALGFPLPVIPTWATLLLLNFWFLTIVNLLLAAAVATMITVPFRKNFFKNLFSGSDQQQSHSQEDESDQGPTWEQVFAHVPAAPGTEAQQQRHKELRQKCDQMTKEDEAELNELFEIIYPQIQPELQRRYERCERNEQ